MILIQLNFGILLVEQLFYVYYKGKDPLSLICRFYCCTVKKGWTLKVAIRGLMAYKPVAHKKINLPYAATTHPPTIQVLQATN